MGLQAFRRLAQLFPNSISMLQKVLEAFISLSTRFCTYRRKDWNWGGNLLLMRAAQVENRRVLVPFKRLYNVKDMTVF